MKKLHRKEIADQFEMEGVVKVRWDLLPAVFELKGHNLQTIDTSYSFMGLMKAYKECRARGMAASDMKVYKINNSTNQKTLEYVNPEYK